MRAPEIIARSISQRRKEDAFGNAWQYNSRSDHHSKVACWATLFDLLLQSPLLRAHAESGEIAFGVNHQMRDFGNSRKKDLDLVICTPGLGQCSGRTLSDYADEKEILLTAQERELLAGLPSLREAPVGAVRMALEAKACMTEHGKARPRLYDELNSSHLTIHGATDGAVAVGLVMVNISDSFVSPGKNQFPLNVHLPHVNQHKQPSACAGVIDKIREMPRRSRMGENGFDAIGLLVVECKNDGSPVHFVTTPPAPQPDDTLHYDSMIRRIADLYMTRFKAI